MIITGNELAKMSLDELEALYQKMQTPTQEQKERAWKKMDTGIYNEEGNLIGDKYWDEDAYEE